MNQSYVIIYLDKTMKNRQIVRPSEKFNQSWTALVDAVTNGNYYKYEIH